jgi:hypothetical protein
MQMKKLLIVFFMTVLISFISFEFYNHNNINNNNNLDFKEIYNKTFDKECIKISNPYFSYFCNRLSYRPHMWSFIANNKIKDNMGGICKNKRGYDQLYCTIHKSLEENNFEYCEFISNDKFKEECNFYFLIKNLNDIKKNYNLYFDYCGKFSNSFWKSECYYVIADELTLLNNSDYFEQINYACSKSDEYNYYSCHGHSAILMDIKLAEEFCESVPFDKKSFCYEGYGFKLGMEMNHSYEKVESECELIDQKNACFEGFFQSLSNKNTNNRPKFIFDTCKLVDQDKKEICYFYYGKFLNNLIIEENFEINQDNYCEKIPIEYQEDCHIGFSYGLDMTTKNSIVDSINICKRSKFSKICMKGILKQIKRYNINDDNICYEFLDELKQECLNSLGQI